MPTTKVVIPERFGCGGMIGVIAISALLLVVDSYLAIALVQVAQAMKLPGANIDRVVQAAYYLLPMALLAFQWWTFDVLGALARGVLGRK